MLKKLIELGQQHTDNVPLLHLINGQSATLTNDSYHPQRGFALLNSQNSSQNIHHVGIGDRRPVWWIFAGMGANWNKMGEEMMKFQIFEKSITRSREILLPTGLDIMNILFSEDQHVFDDVRNAFIGLVSIQIAIVDCLRACGVECDGKHDLQILLQLA